MRANDPFLNPFLEANSCYFGGAPSVPKAPKAAKVPDPPKMEMPEAPPPPAPIPPSPTQSKLEVQEAQDATKAAALKRNGQRKTLIAGDTGGYGASETTKKTLLG